MTTETSIPMVFPAGTSSETKKGKGAVSVQCSEQEESTLQKFPRVFWSHLQPSWYFSSSTVEGRGSKLMNTEKSLFSLTN